MREARGVKLREGRGGGEGGQGERLGSRGQAVMGETGEMPVLGAAGGGGRGVPGGGYTEGGGMPLDVWSTRGCGRGEGCQQEGVYLQGSEYKSLSIAPRGVISTPGLECTAAQHNVTL